MALYETCDGEGFGEGCFRVVFVALYPIKPWTPSAWPSVLPVLAFCHPHHLRQETDFLGRANGQPAFQASKQNNGRAPGGTLTSAGSGSPWERRCRRKRTPTLPPAAFRATTTAGCCRRPAKTRPVKAASVPTGKVRSAAATKAGLEAWQYGFVFSTFKLTMLLGSISTERLMVLSTPLKCYLCGQIGFFLYNVMFGALYWSPGGTVFLALSLVAVIFGGFVQTVYLVSAYSVVTSELHQSSGVIIAIMEFMFGCGNMAGSVLGGALIDLWQYPLPFFVLGTIITLSIPWIIMHKKVPNKHPEAPTEEALMQAPGSQKKLYRLLWDPLFMVNMVTLMLSWVIMGFNEPTLEPYLRQFKLSSTRLGVLYMVQFASYTVGAAFAGVFCYVKMAAFFAFAGQLMTVFAYLILGPAPFVQQDPQLWMVYVSQTFTGVGMAAQFICSFSLALSHAAKRGYPDDIRTTGFVSTVVVTFLVIGAITTPPIAGYLVLKFSYRPGSMFLFGILLFWTPITLLHWIYLMYIQRTRSADVALQERSISSRKS